MKTPPRVALIGFMGSGKTTVGAVLARKLGYRFVDLDAEIEKTAGKRISDIFREDGESFFRDLEAGCLAGFAGRTGIVLSAGGGAPVRESNRQFFTDAACTFFLKIPLKTALERAGTDGSRPLLEQGPEEVKRLFESRAEIYARLGRAIESEGKTPLQVAEEIAGLLDSTTRTPDPG
jgi:shikimate kinase